MKPKHVETTVQLGIVLLDALVARAFLLIRGIQRIPTPQGITCIHSSPQNPVSPLDQLKVSLGCLITTQMSDQHQVAVVRVKNEQLLSKTEKKKTLPELPARSTQSKTKGLSCRQGTVPCRREYLTTRTSQKLITDGCVTLFSVLKKYS